MSSSFVFFLRELVLLLLSLLPFGGQARAKVELREHVTEQDAKDVVDMMQEVCYGNTAALFSVFSSSITLMLVGPVYA